MYTTPGRRTVDGSGSAISGSGSSGSASMACRGRTGRSSVPPKIVNVAFTGLGQIIGPIAGGQSETNLVADWNTAPHRSAERVPGNVVLLPMAQASRARRGE